MSPQERFIAVRSAELTPGTCVGDIVDVVHPGERFHGRVTEIREVNAIVAGCLPGDPDSHSWRREVRLGTVIDVYCRQCKKHPMDVVSEMPVAPENMEEFLRLNGLDFPR